jgi:ferredoxin-type protein NapH
MKSSVQSSQDRQEHIRLYQQHWRDELNSAVLYTCLAKLEHNPKQKLIFKALAATEEGHAEVWERHLQEAGTALPVFKPSGRTRVLLWLAKNVDTALVLPHLARLEHLEAEGYLKGLEQPNLLAEEGANAELLTHLGHHEFSEFVKKVILKIRKFVLLIVATILFAASVLLARNVQLEGLFFGLLGGIFIGPVIHYLLAKFLVALPFGRIWCGWACWTAAVLDQLPYRKSAGWLPGRWRTLRYVHFGLSLVLVFVLFFAVGYHDGALGQRAVYWFLIGNIFYWSVGITLAISLKDNRAFCKYVCPVSVILKQTSKPALLKVSGDAKACLRCKSKACTTLCPMDIRIPDYIISGERVLSNECILCQQCVAVCPPNTLTLSFGLDVGGKNLLEERKKVTKNAS